MWLTTWHSASEPHTPTQGSLHFWLMQARLFSQSSLLTHSGLQFGGEPINSARQLQEGESPLTWHSELGPQGDGWQGFAGTTGTTSSTEITIVHQGCASIAVIHLLIGIHRVNGSPVNLGRQVQMGLWFTTWHSALMPQVPRHGFIHFWFTQAWLSGHSELDIHSGLHVGGLPTNPGTQEHTAWEFISRHWLFGPHGEGLHGFAIVGTKTKRSVRRRKWIDLQNVPCFEQRTKAFPLKPSTQVHVGMWLITLHSAFWPQVPGQGSMHLFLIHALSLGHSVFRTHSGLQPL